VLNCTKEEIEKKGKLKEGEEKEERKRKRDVEESTI